ncbi:ABC transporter substrate-binding protein [Ilumatobacter sp.]|uniref:ABC transporter substrate-binding protein n=1 Tax=Ilumatobacter sp. TaxID=1967498 RepID=UPI00375390FF
MRRRQPTHQFVAICIAVALGIAATGCGSDGGTADAPADGGAPAETTDDSGGAGECGAAGDAGSIDVFLIPSPSSTSIQSFIPAFEAETCIEVNVSETPYGEAHQKQLLAYEQGDGQFDVAQFDNTYLAAFGAAEAMTPLDDYLADSAAYDIGDFTAGQQDYGKYAGQTLGLTLSTEPMIQWFRTDLYDELGLEPAATWEEYYDNAKVISDAGEADGTIMGFGSSASWWWMTLVWSFGGQLYDEDLNPTVNSPEAVAATEYFKSLLDVAPDGAISANGDDVTFKFLSEPIGSMVQYSGYYGFVDDPAANEFPGAIGTALMPLGEADITHLAGWNIGVPADSKNADLGWKFLEYVLGKDNAKAYLESGAAAIGRTSITSDPALVERFPYLELLSIPDSSRIERYPQLKVWPEMDVTIVQEITNILTGENDVQTGLDKLNDALGPILAAENS